MRQREFIEKLIKAGWRPVGDAQHKQIKELHAHIFPSIAELEQELEEMEETSDSWADDFKRAKKLLNKHGIDAAALD